MRRVFRAGFRIGAGPFSLYVRLPVAALAIVGLLGFATCARAGSGPPGAPTVAGCLTVTGGVCQDGGGSYAGGFYSIGRIVSNNGYVYTCAALNASGMCPEPVTLQRWSDVVPETWVLRDRLYHASRVDGILFASLPTAGMIFDSAGYLAGGMWIVDMADVVGALEYLAGIALMVVFAVVMRTRAI